MQAIGPFLVRLPHPSQPGQTELHWCYMVYDDAQETWSMQIAPVQDETFPGFNKSNFTERQPLPNKIHVAARAYQGQLVWESTCMVTQEGKILVYALNNQHPIWYYIADAGERVCASIPYASDFEITANDFAQPTVPEDVGSLCNTLFSNYVEHAKKRIGSGVEVLLNSSSVSVDIRLRTHLSLLKHLENTKDDYDQYSSIWFHGERRSFERFLQLTRLAADMGSMPNEQFIKIITSIGPTEWQSCPLKCIAQFVHKLSPEKAQLFVQTEAIQARLATGLAHNILDIALFSNCNLEVFRTILNLPPVSDVLRSQIQSVAAFISVCKQKRAKKSYVTDALTLQERCEMVHAIGIDTVKTWMTDAENMYLFWGSTPPDFLSQLIWDNGVKFAETVNYSYMLNDYIVMFFANSTHTETEIIQKVTEFIDALPAKQAKELLRKEGTYRSLIESRTIPPAQKIAFFKIPRVYESITAYCFTHIMNQGEFTSVKEPLFEGLFPGKIKAFILETGGDALRNMLPAQQARARSLFTAEELQARLYLFKHMSAPAAPIQPRIQASLFMQIMTHRATPYVAALMLLAGVALFLTAHAVAAAGCAVAGGLLLFGSFMYRQERGMRNVSPGHDVNTQRAYR